MVADVRVPLGGGDIGVAEQFLHGTQIRSPVELARLARSFSRDPYAATWNLYERAGEAATLRFGPRRAHLLFGPEANEWVLSTAAPSLSWREAFRSLIPVDGDTALIVSDGADHARRRRLVQPAFHRRRIDATTALIVGETDRAIDTLDVGSTVDIAAVLRAAIRRIVVRSLFGEHLRDRADDIGSRLQPALDFVNLPPQRQVRLAVPGTRYRAALRARSAVDTVIDDELARRRREREKGIEPADDVLTMLLEAAGWLDADDAATERLTHEEVRDQVVSLIAAGYDTTSATAAWAVWRTLRDPGVLALAHAEVDAELGEAAPTSADLPRLPWIGGIVNETLRLHPAAAISARVASEPLRHADVAIGTGDLVLYCPAVTHRMPELWPDPLGFRPGRWVPGHADHHDVATYSFVPFGGGRRRCLGLVFATVELQLLLCRLVQRTALRLVDPTPPRPVGTAAVAPEGGVRVVVERVDPATDPAPVQGQEVQPPLT